MLGYDVESDKTLRLSHSLRGSVVRRMELASISFVLGLWQVSRKTTVTCRPRLALSAAAETRVLLSRSRVALGEKFHRGVRSFE